MPTLFYISSAVAILATLMVITRYNPIHALLYLVISFMAVALIFVSLGAPFVAALEVILYAGAIIVLLIFMVMMMNISDVTARQERLWLQPRVWIGPSLLALVLLGELVVLLLQGGRAAMDAPPVAIRRVSLALYGEYVIAVELAGFLLMAGIVGAAHIAKHRKKHLHRYLQEGPPEAEPGQVSVVPGKEAPPPAVPLEQSEKVKDR